MSCAASQLGVASQLQKIVEVAVFHALEECADFVLAEDEHRPFRIPGVPYRHLMAWQPGRLDTVALGAAAHFSTSEPLAVPRRACRCRPLLLHLYPSSPDSSLASRSIQAAQCRRRSCTPKAHRTARCLRGRTPISVGSGGVPGAVAIPFWAAEGKLPPIQRSCTVLHLTSAVASALGVADHNARPDRAQNAPADPPKACGSSHDTSEHRHRRNGASGAGRR